MYGSSFPACPHWPLVCALGSASPHLIPAKVTPVGKLKQGTPAKKLRAYYICQNDMKLLQGIHGHIVEIYRTSVDVFFNPGS